ncbi:MAG: amidohydrolase family protein, partial [Acidimicrobiales bacterium]|nr:amidohydrolase family protein [Acidimicrobiales bacterium]
LDAFTRHLDPALGPRCVQWATIDGRQYHVLGGRISRAVSNATFDPVSKPGCLYDYFRGNAEGVDPLTRLRDHEPIRPEYRDRDARLAVMDEQGLAAALLFPTLGVGVEDALKDDPEACMKVFEAFNRWVEDDWGHRYRDRLFAVPYISLLDPGAAAAELARVIEAGAIAVNVRSAPVPVPGGHRSPFDRAYDGVWGLAAEAGVAVATHAGIDGYDTLVQMWEPGGGESSLFRSPLRGIVTKGRAVSDFFAAALCHKVFE